MSSSDSSVGVVGLGAMGGLMARFMAESGIPTVGYDLDDQAMRRAAGFGVQPAASTSDLATRCDRVLVVVVDDDQVRGTLLGPEGLLTNLRPGCSIAICASVRPSTCRELDRLAADRKISLLDVALVGGARALDQRRLTLYCGGSETALAAFVPAFRSFATNVCAAGPTGSAQIAKVANNVLLWSCVRIDLEAQALARAMGLDPAVLRPMLAIGTGANQAITDWGQHRPQWPKKDLELALSLADEAGVAVPYMRKLGDLIGSVTPENIADLITE